MPASDIRLALFSGNYHNVRDGANRALNRLVDYMQRQGAKVLVFSPIIKEPAFKPTGRVVPTGSIPVPFRPDYRFTFFLSAKHKKILADFGPNIIHLSAPEGLGYSALRYAKKNGLPVVASVHTRFETYLDYYHLEFLKPVLMKYLRHFYRSCDQVYAPSQSLAETLIEQGFTDDPMTWTRGVDCDLYHPDRRSEAWRARHGVGPDEKVVAFVSRLVLEKGLAIIVAAHRRLKKQGVAHRLLIVGDGPERERLERDLPEAIFTGFIEGDELAAAYASSDVFLFPSLTETFGNVTLEAMASGLPAVCADATGSKSLVRHGETGFLAAPNDVSDFARQVTLLLQDDDLRARMSIAARRRAEASSWDAVMGRLLENYEELLGHAKAQEEIRLAGRQAA